MLFNLLALRDLWAPLQRLDLPTTQLPLHQLAKGTLGVGRKLFVGPFLGNSAIRANDNDAIGPLDS
jgi:hypothetical protein